MIEYAAQPGPQVEFLRAEEDIVLYGGAAGGGKTFAVLLDHARNIAEKGYRGVIMRRVGVDLNIAGGLREVGLRMFGELGADTTIQPAAARWRTGGWDSLITFAHCEHETDIVRFQGLQATVISIDEVTQWTERMVLYLLSRLRSESDIRPYMRLTCNPSAGSWLRAWVEPYLDADGYPDPHVCATLVRWVRGEENRAVWHPGTPTDDEIASEGWQSFRFIPSKVTDNAALVRRDPSYMGKLASLTRVEREQLLHGNWNASVASGLYRHVRWRVAELRDVPPALAWVRYWDMASTAPSEANPNPDWTAGVMMAAHNGTVWVRDVCRIRAEPSRVESFIRMVADFDGAQVPIWIEQEPGASGKTVVSHYQRNVLFDRLVAGDRPSGDKVTRQLPLVGYAEAGNVVLARGEWNQDFIAEAATYPDGKRDQLDAAAGALSVLTPTSGARVGLSRREPGATLPAAPVRKSPRSAGITGRVQRPRGV